MITNHAVQSTIPAKDLARARKFYEEKLGYKPDKVSPDGVFYKSNGCASFFLYETPSAGTAQHTLLAWETTHLDADMKDLRSRGVKFVEYDMPGLKTQDGVATTPDGTKAAWFKDSEGNILGIAQM